jgi:hypothetical protein
LILFVFRRQTRKTTTKIHPTAASREFSAVVGVKFKLCAKNRMVLQTDAIFKIVKGPEK